MKEIKKWTPSIIIYEVVIEFGGELEQRLYFLSSKRAEKFLDNHKEELQDYETYIGGVQLWLW